jgi:hypothetical protein
MYRRPRARLEFVTTMLNESSSSLPLQNPKRHILGPSQSWLPTNFWNSWAAWPWKFLSNFLSLHNLLSLQQLLSFFKYSLKRISWTVWVTHCGEKLKCTVAAGWGQHRGHFIFKPTMSCHFSLYLELMFKHPTTHIHQECVFSFYFLKSVLFAYICMFKVSKSIIIIFHCSS